MERYYKIVNPKGHRGLIYKEGLNTDLNPWNPNGSCEGGGIYFAKEDIFAFLDHGSELYEVEPVGEIYEDPDDRVKKYKAHSVVLKYIGPVVDNIEFLIKEGANVHADDDYVLRWTTRKGHTEVVKILIAAGADVHAVKDYALCWAAEHGHTETVKILLDAGADIHADNDYALRWAAEHGHTEVVKILLDAGADIHADDDYALRWATRKDHTEVVKILKDAMGEG